MTIRYRFSGDELPLSAIAREEESGWSVRHLQLVVAMAAVVPAPRPWAYDTVELPPAVAPAIVDEEPWLTHLRLGHDPGTQVVTLWWLDDSAGLRAVGEDDPWRPPVPPAVPIRRRALPVPDDLPQAAQPFGLDDDGWRPTRRRLEFTPVVLRWLLEEAGSVDVAVEEVFWRPPPRAPEAPRFLGSWYDAETYPTPPAPLEVDEQYWLRSHYQPDRRPPVQAVTADDVLVPPIVSVPVAVRTRLVAAAEPMSTRLVLNARPLRTRKVE